MGLGKRIIGNPSGTLLTATLIGGVAGVALAPRAPPAEYFLSVPATRSAVHQQVYTTAQLPVTLATAVRELDRRQTAQVYGLLEEQFATLASLNVEKYPREFSNAIEKVRLGAGYALARSQNPGCTAPCVRGDEPYVRQLQQDASRLLSLLHQYEATGGLAELAQNAQFQTQVQNTFHAGGHGIAFGFTGALAALTLAATYARKEDDAIAAQFSPEESS
jgi:hypothetical protein